MRWYWQLSLTPVLNHLVVNQSPRYSQWCVVYRRRVRIPVIIKLFISANMFFSIWLGLLSINTAIWQVILYWDRLSWFHCWDFLGQDILAELSKYIWENQYPLVPSTESAQFTNQLNNYKLKDKDSNTWRRMLPVWNRQRIHHQWFNMRKP